MLPYGMLRNKVNGILAVKIERTKLTNIVTLIAKSKIRFAAEPAPNSTPILAVIANRNTLGCDLKRPLSLEECLIN